VTIRFGNGESKSKRKKRDKKKDFPLENVHFSGILVIFGGLIFMGEYKRV